MKQLTKVQLQDAKELTPGQMKDIKGGMSRGNGCNTHDVMQCYGPCGDIVSGMPVSGTCQIEYGLCACVVF